MLCVNLYEEWQIWVGGMAHHCYYCLLPYSFSMTTCIIWKHEVKMLAIYAGGAYNANRETFLFRACSNQTRPTAASTAHKAEPYRKLLSTLGGEGTGNRTAFRKSMTSPRNMSGGHQTEGLLPR